jgi:hypothetical protein
MAKPQKNSNKGNGTQGQNVTGGTMASALQKVKAGIGAIAPLLKNEGVDAEIPALGTMQLDALEKADPVKKSELDAALSELADLAKGVRDLNEGLEKRSEELKRLKSWRSSTRMCETGKSS